MTDKERKERLDAIKGRAMFNQLAKRTGEITHSLFTLDADDYDWLIQQAERAQELELEEEYKVRQTEYLEEHIERLEGKLGLCMEILEAREETHIIAEYQKKRYREALETIEMVTEFKSEANEIANKALEGDAKE